MLRSSARRDAAATRIRSHPILTKMAAVFSDDKKAFATTKRSSTPRPPRKSSAKVTQRATFCRTMAGRVVYVGPLHKTTRLLKRFSVGSFGLAIAAVPFLMTIDAAVGPEMRMALASTAILTSGGSTAMVYYAMNPYITRITLPGLENPATTEYEAARIDENTILNVQSWSFLGRPKSTLVMLKELRKTQRPFATWRDGKGRPWYVHKEVVQTPEMQQILDCIERKNT